MQNAASIPSAILASQLASSLARIGVFAPNAAQMLADSRVVRQELPVIAAASLHGASMEIADTAIGLLLEPLQSRLRRGELKRDGRSAGRRNNRPLLRNNQFRGSLRRTV